MAYKYLTTIQSVPNRNAHIACWHILHVDTCVQTDTGVCTHAYFSIWTDGVKVCVSTHTQQANKHTLTRLISPPLSREVAYSSGITANQWRSLSTAFNINALPHVYMYRVKRYTVCLLTSICPEPIVVFVVKLGQAWFCTIKLWLISSFVSKILHKSPLRVPQD